MNTTEHARPILEVRELRKYFPLSSGIFNKRAGTVHAVDDISFSVMAGETLGIVGESGCGKSTTARLLMRLIEPDAGRVLLEGKGIAEPVPNGMAIGDVRRQMQMVFQDSFASLNPRLTIEDSIAFGPVVHGLPRRQAKRARELLARVGLAPGAMPRATRTSSPAGSASASTSRARSRCSRGS